MRGGGYENSSADVLTFTVRRPGVPCNFVSPGFSGPEAIRLVSLPGPSSRLRASCLLIIFQYPVEEFTELYTCF
jgi:hypothetical protein